MCMQLERTPFPTLVMNTEAHTILCANEAFLSLFHISNVDLYNQSPVKAGVMTSAEEHKLWDKRKEDFFQIMLLPCGKPWQTLAMTEVYEHQGIKYKQFVFVDASSLRSLTIENAQTMKRMERLDQMSAELQEIAVRTEVISNNLAQLRYEMGK